MKRILNCVLVCMIIFSLAANVMADEPVLDDPEYIEELDLPEMTDEEMRVLNNSVSLLYDAENSESDHAVIYRSEEELAVLHLELERELERMLAEAPILTYDGAAVLTNDGAAVSEAAAAQAQVLTLSAANKAPMVAAGTSHNVFLKADGTVYTWGDYSLEETYTAPAKVAGIDHVVEVDAGNNFSLALRSDGTVWAWGYAGSSGVLGTDAQGQPVGSSMTPVQVSGLSNITAISAGEYHCLALEADGTVWAWGTNTYGQLGAAGFTYTAAPLQINGLNSVKAVSAGGDHSVVLKSDGTMRTFGRNNYGQLGTGAVSDAANPVPALVSNTGAVRFTGISAGSGYTLAVSDNGEVYACGRNNYGQLGIGSSTDKQVLTKIDGLGYVGFIAAGSGSSFAISNGTLYSWGQNTYGQLGRSSTSTNTPQSCEVPDAVSAAAGARHTVVLTADGSLYTCGSNTNYQIGNGTEFYTDVPQKVYISADVINFSAAWHYLAVKEDGSVWSWGDNSNGQLGLGTYDEVMKPARIEGLSGITAVSAGDAHSLALKEDGTVWSWGDNYYGQLGLGDTVARATPTMIEGLDSIVAIAAGEEHNMALAQDGSVYVWGDNTFGQLGDGSTTDKNVPALMNIEDVVAIRASLFGSAALKSDGTLWVWGYQGGQDVYTPTQLQFEDDTVITDFALGYGFGLAADAAGNVWSWITTAGTSIAITEPANIEKVFAGIFTGAMIKDGVLYTGNGTAAQSYTPVPLEDVVLFNCYYDNYFALTASGTLYAWNSGNWGQIGDGITSAYYTDWQKIATTTFGIKQFDISGAHSLVLMSNGEVYASGSNGPGQLGSPTANGPCFTKCSVSGIKQVAAGSLHSLGLKEDGSVLSWGRNDDGMLGRPQTESSVIPGLVVMQNGEPLTDIVSVGAGRYHSLALKADGTVWSFGYNLHGELGTGEPLGEDAVTNHFAKQVVDKNGAPIQGIVEIAVGTYHSLALKSDGTVYAWGLGNYGRLGTGFIGNQICAVSVKDSTGNGVLTGIKSIGAGSFHSMAVANDGTVYTWGLNNFGQLGNNLEATSCLLPTSVVHTDGSLLSDVVKITGGEYHTMALLSDGTVYCWGSDTEGQLGSNAVSDRSPVPVRVSSYLNSGETYLSNVVDITAGTSGNMVLTADNRLFAWGKNTSDLFAVSAQKTIPIPVQAYAGKIVFDDYADDFSAAASVIVNTVVSGAINDAGDADCFVFTPALTENYTISVLDGAVSAALYDLKTGAVIEPGATQRYALKSGTSYGVKITADAVTDYQFKIGLSTEELIISAPVFSLGINGGTPLNAITAGFISGRVDIANATNSEKTAMVIMTLLDHSNTLFDVRTVQSTIPAGASSTVTTGFNVPADYPNYKIVLSVWNNMDMMERLMPDATLE